jgi:sec-independent protein translocase protein TatA
MLIILVIAVLLYGKRLPEVARSLGKGFAEFQKGLRGIEQELHSTINSSISPSSSSLSSSSSSSAAHPYADEVDDHEEATAPKFEPPPSEPQPALIENTHAPSQSPAEAVEGSSGVH